MSFNELKECRYGPLLFNKNDWPIGTSLRTYGQYAWDELELLRKFIKPGDVVVDAGANIGTHTVFFAQLVGNGGCVIAFEPQRISYQTLCANVALNSLTNVFALHAALGKEAGTIIVPVRDQNMPNNFGGVPLAGITEGEPTDLLRLDQLNMKSCDMIKADVEGMEAELLIGARETIAKHRPLMYLEADGAQSKEAIQMLFDWNYECYWSIPPLYSVNNFTGERKDVFRSEDQSTTIVSVNMLCVPAERQHIIQGLERIHSVDDSPPKTINIELWKEECLV